MLFFTKPEPKYAYKCYAYKKTCIIYSIIYNTFLFCFCFTQISLVGALLIFGLFVAALSSILGGLVGPPRVLQRIAEDNVLPILKPFAELVSSVDNLFNTSSIFDGKGFSFSLLSLLSACYLSLREKKFLPGGWFMGI